MIGKPRGRVVLLTSAVPAPLSDLSDLLAQTLIADFEDRACVLRLRADAEQPQGLDTGERIITVPPGDDPPESLWAAIAHARNEHDWIFLDVPRRPAELLKKVGSFADYVIFFARDTFTPLPVPIRPGCRVVFVVSVDPPHRDYHPRLFRAGTVRLSRRPGEYEGRRNLREMSQDGRASLSRLARALSDRSVGLALGGGGAWGFAHVALIQALCAAEIPIDMVAGVSFGAVVGSFYAAEGLEGLERLMSRGKGLNLAVWSSIVNSAGITQFVERSLSERYLERLALPFFPVATNVESYEAEPIRMGRIGVGVRASSCLPGLLSPTVIGSKRYVDGGISCNVPANLLPGEGADMIIASNVIQRHRRFGDHDYAPRGRLRTFLSEIDPRGRAKDLILSLTNLTNRTGEVLTLCAHVSYQAQPNDFTPWDFARGRGIVEACRRDVEPAVARAREGWQVLVREGGRQAVGA